MERKIIQITSGRGPEECSWVVTQLTRCFLKEVQRKDIKCVLLKSVERSGSGTFTSVNFLLEGLLLDKFLSKWTGSILWIGKSPYRKNHKRNNWFVGFQTFKLTDESSFDARDVKIEVKRSSGPGGQHANKVESAVKITHKPTGITVECSMARSQRMNKQIALQELKQKLEFEKQQQKKKESALRWSGHNQLERGSPTRTYKGSKFKLHNIK